MARRKNARRGHIEGTYLFKDKDPIIDILRSGIANYAAKRQIKMAKAIREVCEIAGVSTACVNNWLYGTVGKPYWWSACAVGIAARIEHFEEFIPSRERRKFKVITGGKAA